MDKCQEIKNEIFKIVYSCVCDVVPLPEKIKIDPTYTSRSLDGCTSESGKVYKNDNRWFSVYIKYGRYCVCMVRLEAETLAPIQVEIGNGNRENTKFNPYKIEDIYEIKNYSNQMQTHLRNMLD